MLFDLDSTLLNTYGMQEGEGFNYHYQGHGYHPLFCYDGLTGDLLKFLLSLLHPQDWLQMQHHCPEKWLSL